MRVTLDLDYPSTQRVCKAWCDLKRVGNGRVRGRVSSSGEGIHLETFGAKRDPTELRRELGDDEWRLALDESQSWRPGQVLYDEKLGKQSGEWWYQLDKLLRAYRGVSPPGREWPSLPP